ncbi:DUF6319 family protein [Pseudonocardia endophytica]|uniref:Uncharacterized protein n=1 Tax=Pseudonocardia endophytica TaxID=401976 RepID=A0A4R1HJM5_PSEEN|nr:hypothetical protein EV378_6532 [Pseudonocardia endophytica]
MTEAPTGTTAPADVPAAPDTAPDAAPDTSAETTVESGAEEQPTQRKRGRPKGSTARTTRVVSMTLTVSGSADGEWQAELKNGSTWVARGLPVTASAVSQAAAALHADLAGPVDEVIDAARSTRAARVAELEAELEQAKKALAEME